MKNNEEDILEFLKDISYSNNYDDNIETLKKFDMFLKELNIKLNFEEISIILDNSKLLNDIISIVVKSNINIIELGNINKIFNSYNLNLLLKAYCMLNDINTEKIYTNEEIISKIEKISSSKTIEAKENLKNRKLSKDEELDLIKKYKNGDEKALKILVERNYRLVVSIVLKYNNQNVEFDDLIQEGNIGLIKAIKKFDIKRKTRLSTYATWWIRHEIKIFIIDNSRIIRLPYGNHEIINKIKYVTNDFYIKNSRKPTIEELSEILDISKVTIENVLKNFLSTQTCSLKKFKNLKMMSKLILKDLFQIMFL